MSQKARPLLPVDPNAKSNSEIPVEGYCLDVDDKGDITIYIHASRNIILPLILALAEQLKVCLLYTSPSPRDQRGSRMPSSA